MTFDVDSSLGRRLELHKLCARVGCGDPGGGALRPPPLILPLFG